jgi:MarR family transcriptional regulator, 2-MHQ and catechol-resistance regulon repressor
VPTHYKGDERTRRALDAYIKLSRARKVMGDRTSRFLAEYGLTESQLGTLEALYYLGPMHQSKIGDKLLVTGGNMTMVINNLEKRGLITRQRDGQDRRQLTVSLTEKGQRLIDEMFPRHAQNIADLMDILCPEEQEQLGQLCKMLGKQTRDGNQSGS